MGNSLSVRENLQESSTTSGKVLINTFSCLVTNLKSKSFQSLPDPTVVADYICDLPISRNSQASANLIPQLRNAQSLDQVFELIGPFIKFNQYDLLTYLVDKFGEEDAKKELQQYSSSVEQFNSTTTVGQLVELLVEQQEEWTDEDKERLKSAQEQGATIKMILDNSYSSRSLDQLQQDVQSLFDCEEYLLALAEARFGCIELLWYTSLSVVGYLVEKARGNGDKLEEMSVIALMIGNNIIQGNFPSLSSQSPRDSLHDSYDSASEMQSSNEKENGEVSADGPPSKSNVSIEVIIGAIRTGLAPEVSRLLDRLSLDVLVDVLQQVNEDGLSLLHIAVNSKSLDTVRAVLSAIDRTHEDNLRWLTDAKDVSPLHLAFQSGDLSIIEALLKYPSFTVIPPGHKNLLKMATEDPEQSLAKLKLILDHSRGNPLTLYPDFQSHFPTVKVPRSDLESTIPVIVVGDSNAGKSTLIKSLQIEGVRSQLYHLFVNVSDVSVHKAGIIPTPFESIWFGNVVFYDLSSNREFVHEAIQQCGFLSDAVFIVVINLHDKTHDITKQLVYWLDFVHYHHQKVTGYDTNRLPNVAIVGSHLHKLRIGHLANRERFLHHAYPIATHHFDQSQFNIIAQELMDCRKSSVPNTILRLALSHELQRLRAIRTQIPSKSYILYGIIKELCSNRNVSYVSIVDVLPQLYTNELLIIEPTVNEVIELCQPLCKLNLLLVLQDEEELDKSWIVIDSRSLLSTIEKVIFGYYGPKPIDGIMTHYELSVLFSAVSINPDMMIKLMSHYCYSTKISRSQSPLPSWIRQNRYFIPHILPETPMAGISQQDLMFAWSISPTSPFHHFMPHIIHHFLLQLSQEPEISREHYDRARHTLVTSFPFIGLQLVVHVFSSQSIIVSMMKSENDSEEKKIKCLEMRNRLITKIRHVLQDIDHHNWANLSPVEALISGRDLLHPVRYPVLKIPMIKELFGRQYKHTYSVDDVRIAVQRRSPHVQPIGHPGPLSSVEDLLIFEPYFYMSDEVRSALTVPGNPDESISAVFFESLARDLGLDQLYLVLSAIGISSTDIEDIKNAPSHQVLGTAYAHVQGNGITYEKLKIILDSISFFKLDDIV